MIEPEIDSERRSSRSGSRAPSPTSCSSDGEVGGPHRRAAVRAPLLGIGVQALWPRKNHAGQRVYRKHDVQMVLRIKGLPTRTVSPSRGEETPAAGGSAAQPAARAAGSDLRHSRPPHDSSPAGGDPADAATNFPLNPAGARRTIRGVRGVAQPGSALAWGARGRWFKSSRPDHFPPTPGRGESAALRSRSRPGSPRAA